jgi:hypothetical protein
MLRPHHLERPPDQVTVATKSKDTDGVEGEGGGETVPENTKWWD